MHRPLAFIRLAVEAGDGRKRALGKPQNFADGVFLGLTGQAVSAAAASHALNDICLDKDADDAFKVFLRYILRLCDGVEPLVFAVLA